MKKYLFLTLAAFAFAACAEKDIDDNTPVQTGELEEAYIAINLSASDITRADDAPAFTDGEEAERAVSHADFFFFDESGNAFNVTGNPATTPGGGINHLRAADVTFSADSNTGDDISDTSTPVLLLKTYKGQYPSQIVAVLNWSPDNNTAYSLEELHTAVAIQGTFKNTQNEDTKYFVMSNAVYAQGTTEVCATPLTIENIKTTEVDALAAPVNIYVERVAAKVSVIANEKYALENDVYAKIISWDLYRDNSQSKLLKDINPTTWTADDLGFNWNDSPWYRSYWATSLAAPTDDQIFNTGFAAGAHTYIGENTTGKATCTKAVIKAQLVKTVGGTETSLELAIWNNVEYVEDINLRTAVANTLKNTYFAMTEETDGTKKYTGLKPEDLQCVAGGTTDAPAGVAANEVYFQLSTAGKEKDWYKLVNGVYENVANDLANDAKSVKATNEALKNVPAAVLYEDGYTFYYVDIKHLGAAGKTAEYGIVRNHIYNVTINSIKGYGSPVYTGTEFIDYPQISDQETYVSAKINILSWRLVNQQVDIQPNN
ncbi:MAG: Mfa1 fimbrilin C-terminal domain-containing protein [Alistipes sp.]|nr:Mfa1 fimbrilin C-terminal domain-containing protein [Alistipes sp.]